MKKAYFIFLSVFFYSLFSYAQVDTFYLNNYFYVTTKDSAHYLRTATFVNEKKYYLQTFTLQNQLISGFFAISKNAHILDGFYFELNKKGDTLVHGNYSKGFKVGIWNYYFQNGRKKEVQKFDSTNHLYYSWKYDSISQKIIEEGAIDQYGKHYGIWKKYFDNSDSIKLLNYFVYGKKEGEQIEYYQNGKQKRNEIFQNGKFIKGTLWDEQQKKIKYFPAFRYPQYPEYLNTYLLRETPCIINYINQSIVQIKIKISKEGVVQKAEIIGIETIECAKQIENALMEMKKWKPAYWENNPITYTYETVLKTYTQRE